jgi:hypothetical protein
VPLCQHGEWTGWVGGRVDGQAGVRLLSADRLPQLAVLAVSAAQHCSLVGAQPITPLLTVSCTSIYLLPASHTHLPALLAHLPACTAPPARAACPACPAGLVDVRGVLSALHHPVPHD